MEESQEMLVTQLDGVPFCLKRAHDFSFLGRYGKVFAVYDDQDSGNLCFGLRGEGEARWFLKYAGAPTYRYEGDLDQAVERLKRAGQVYEDLRHPSLIPFLRGEKMGEGYGLLFQWVDGVCMGKQYPQQRRRFFTLPVEKREAVMEQVLSFHRHVVSRGYVSVDFYDGSILYDFSQDRAWLCDIDLYEKMPFVNRMGRMWGSTRFMSPEEFTLGAELDEKTMVFLMGAVAFALLGGETDHARERWVSTHSRYETALQAVSPRREQRQASLEEFARQWELPGKNK